MKKLLLLFLIVFNFSDSYSQCLSGSYTIGGASPDFSNFSAAISSLATNGICGSVVFNVRSGTYSEQLTIPAIVGTNISNTITFQSESNDSTSVILTFPTATSISTPNYTLKINGCDHTHFSKITLSRVGNDDYARVIDIGNNSDSVVFQNCVIKNTRNSGYDNTTTLVYSPYTASGSDSLTFIANRFEMAKMQYLEIIISTRIF
jgi:pectin methylesterase-like acyl-CoA thioesterase